MLRDVTARIKRERELLEVSIRLRVWDDGAGIRRLGGSEGGMGLRIMRFRAEAIGGTLMIRTPPGGGMEIACVAQHRALLALKG